MVVMVVMVVILFKKVSVTYGLFKVLDIRDILKQEMAVMVVVLENLVVMEKMLGLMFHLELLLRI